MAEEVSFGGGESRYLEFITIEQHLVIAASSFAAQSICSRGRKDSRAHPEKRDRPTLIHRDRRRQSTTQSPSTSGRTVVVSVDSLELCPLTLRLVTMPHASNDESKTSVLHDRTATYFFNLDRHRKLSIKIWRGVKIGGDNRSGALLLVRVLRFPPASDAYRSLVPRSLRTHRSAPVVRLRPPGYSIDCHLRTLAET